MTKTQKLSPYSAGAALASALVVLLLAGAWVRPAKGQPSARKVLASSPLRVAQGHHVLLACVAGGPKAIGTRFHLVNAITGMPVANSAEATVAPGQSSYFDVFAEITGLYYGAVEVAGPSSDNVACSLEQFDPAGTPVAYAPMAMNMQF
jgi:hypothetical protein